MPQAHLEDRAGHARGPERVAPRRPSASKYMMAEYARVADIDWGKRASMHFDGASGQDSTLSVHNGKVSAGPPTVEKRRATWEVDLAGPRIFASAFRFDVDGVTANRGLRSARGRTVVIRSLIDDGGPFCVVVWHLDASLRVPPLVRSLCPSPSGRRRRADTFRHRRGRRTCLGSSAVGGR